VNRASNSSALVSEGVWALRGIASGVPVRLSLLVLILILTIFPEPVNSRFVFDE
jgi:hypothetical protein